MTRNAKDEAEREKLDLALDQELEATFPASDALKITQRHPDRPVQIDRMSRIKAEVYS